MIDFETKKKRLKETLKFVEENESHWDQSVWGVYQPHCGTTCCYEGFASILAVQERHGERFNLDHKIFGFGDPNDMYSATLIDDERVVDVAKDWLGLTDSEHRLISGGSNSINELRHYVSLFCHEKSAIEKVVENFIDTQVVGQQLGYCLENKLLTRRQIKKCETVGNPFFTLRYTQSNQD